MSITPGYGDLREKLTTLLSWPSNYLAFMENGGSVQCSEYLKSNTQGTKEMYRKFN